MSKYTQKVAILGCPQNQKWLMGKYNSVYRGAIASKLSFFERDTLEV